MQLQLGLGLNSWYQGITQEALLPGESEARAALGFDTEDAIQGLLLRGTSQDWLDHNTLVDYTSGAYRGGATPHHGAVVNSPCLTIAGTAAPNCDHVFFNNSPVHGLTEWSLSLWVRVGTWGGQFQEIISSPGFTTELRIRPSGNLEFVAGHPGHSTVTIQDPTNFPIAQWAHVVVTWLDGTARLYVNGVQVGTATATFTDTDWEDNWCLGCRQDISLPFNGRLMQLLTWSRAITPAEITTLAGHGLVTTDLLEAWPLCEGAGLAVYGLSDIADAGTVINATAGLWTNTQDLYHHALQYGAEVYLSTSTPGNYLVIPHDFTGQVIAHGAPGGRAAIADFAAGRLFEGLGTRIDCTDGGAFTDGGAEANYQFGVARTSPRWVKDTESQLVKRVRAGTATKLVCYGTSLTQGTGGSWVSQLNTWVRYRNTVLTTVNAGAGGVSSVYGLANVNTQVIAQNPDVVTIEFAINDADIQQGVPTTVAEARQNTEDMIDAILTARPNCEIWLLTTNPVTDANSNGVARHPDLASYYQNYNNIVADRADPRVRLMDSYADWLELDQATLESYIPDAVHPTEAGCNAVLVPSLKRRLVGTGQQLYIFDAGGGGAGIFGPEFGPEFE